MPNPVIQKFIAELKEARQPYLITETQVVCGRVALTAAPGIDSDRPRSFRLDLPPDVQPSESPYWLLFLVSVFDTQTFCDIQPRIRRGILASGEYSEIIKGWRLRMFTEGGHRILETTSTDVP